MQPNIGSRNNLVIISDIIHVDFSGLQRRSNGNYAIQRQYSADQKELWSILVSNQPSPRICSGHSQSC